MAALAPTLWAFARPAHAPRSCRRVSSSRVGRSASRVSPRAAGWFADPSADVPDAVSADAPLRVLVAGGGLGCLFAAICLRNAGADVVVL